MGAMAGEYCLAPRPTESQYVLKAIHATVSRTEIAALKSRHRLLSSFSQLFRCYDLSAAAGSSRTETLLILTSSSGRELRSVATLPIA